MITNQQHKPYPLEEIPHGCAKVSIIKTQDGSYGLHGSNKWDDLPDWEFWDAWIVSGLANGDLDYGPFKQRKNAKKEYSGRIQISIHESGIYRDEKEAHDNALLLAISLEQRGFVTQIEFAEDYKPRNLKMQYLFEEVLHPIVLRNLRPRLKDLYLNMG